MVNIQAANWHHVRACARLSNNAANAGSTSAALGVDGGGADGLGLHGGGGEEGVDEGVH